MVLMSEQQENIGQIITEIYRLREAIEDDLTTLQKRLQSGTGSSSHDRTIAQIEQQVQEIRQNPLWHEMQKTASEVQQMKERFHQS